MTSRKGRTRLSASLGALVAVWMAATPFSVDPAEGKSLWPVYEQALKGAKYVDLTHTITPNIPVLGRLCRFHLRPCEGRFGHRGIRQEGRRLNLREARLSRRRNMR
jgi:hypothetical protein